MSRKLTEPTLVMATHNAGKVAELRDMLGGVGPKIVSAGELNLPEPEETENTFLGNGTLKAVAGAKASGLPCLADDSGLCVYALDGAPGVYSADWAGTPRDFNKAMQLVHDQMGDAQDRRAAFVSVWVLAWPDGHIEHSEGRIEGTIVWPPRGDQGFGYDPMFVPEGESRTFAEMSVAEKKGFSHRARAFKALKALTA